MKDCFLKLHSIPMDNIIDVAFAVDNWHTYLDTYEGQKTPRYVSNMPQGIWDAWNQDMQFISDLILPKKLEPYVTITAMNKIPPNYEFGAHTDTYRECCLYLPIYPVKEKYMPMMFYHDNQEICIDNYDIGQVYLCNLKVLHRVCNSTDLPRFNYQITLNKPYDEICKLIAS